MASSTRRAWSSLTTLDWALTLHRLAVAITLASANTVTRDLEAAFIATLLTSGMQPSGSATLLVAIEPP
jgi:hypothetical protein